MHEKNAVVKCWKLKEKLSLVLETLSVLFIYLFIFVMFFLKLGFTPCKTKQTLRGMELQERKHKKDYRIQKICLEKTYS